MKWHWCNSFILIPLDIRNSQKFVGEMFSVLWENANPSQLKVSAGKSLNFLVLKYFLGEKLQKATFFNVNSKIIYIFFTVVFQKSMRKTQVKM